MQKVNSKILKEDRDWAKKYAEHYCVTIADVIHKAILAAQREVQRRDFKRAENIRLRIK